MRPSRAVRGTWSTMWMVALLACHGTPRSGAAGDEEKEANMQLTLLIDRTQLVVGEDTPLTLVVRNDGKQAVKIAHPEEHTRWPKWRLLRKSTGQTVEFGPTEVIQSKSHEFSAPLDDLELDLDAGGEFRLDTRLLERYRLPAAGAYALTAVYELGGREVVSAPVNIEITPLRLQALACMGLHSGQTSYQMAVWACADSAGSVIGVTQLLFTEGGDEMRTFSTRVATTDKPARPAGSVTANKLSYSRQWLAWLSGDEVIALYHDYGRLMMPSKIHKVGADNTVMVGRILNDLTGNDGSTPGRGDFGLLDRSGGRNRLLLRSLTPKGGLDKGPSVTLGSGEFVWGQSALASGGTRRFVTLIQGSHECRLEAVDWGGKSSAATASEIGAWPGTAWSAGVAMNENDQLLGVVLVQKGDAAQAVPWRRSIDGKTTMLNPIALDAAFTSTPRRAYVEVSPTGEFVAVVEAKPREWWLCGSHGRCVPLPADLAATGEPVGACWRTASLPMLIIANENTGLHYVDVPRF